MKFCPECANPAECFKAGRGRCLDQPAISVSAPAPKEAAVTPEPVPVLHEEKAIPRRGRTKKAD